ncbi:MAG: peptide chain release factor N(5)-glutamine methyltransferase [Bacteroidales bacterium]|nr:peptide chain release factor N(5)-glutamine methyltransferase [Bacteroidales bacterium]MDD3844561.1 peptide chain release factor N(5)-glutamine methyltransferase [Bacteroidales bacterium]MDD4618969.1 peptide chain release factor N(5)-glutamine methyltransferase [Bacteroidales bacterium]
MKKDERWGLAQLNIFTFVGMNIREFIDGVVVRLAGVYPAQEAKAMVIRLLQHYCEYSSYEHIVEPDRVIDTVLAVQLEDAVRQLEKSRPLQYVIGWQEFCGLKMEVEEGVLIPRPETEELVMWAEEFFKERALEKQNERKFTTQDEKIRILDAACGSGAIAAAIANKFPHAEVYACDLSRKALEISAKNFKSNNCFNAKVFECDLLSGDAIQMICDFIGMDNRMNDGILDMIISNPPYVTNKERSQMRPNVLDYEPAEALFVPDKDPLLFYRALERLARVLLAPGGAILMEINEQFATETSSLFQEPYFTLNEIRKDFNDKPRMVKAVKI